MTKALTRIAFLGLDSSLLLPCHDYVLVWKRGSHTGRANSNSVTAGQVNWKSEPALFKCTLRKDKKGFKRKMIQFAVEEQRPGNKPQVVGQCQYDLAEVMNASNGRPVAVEREVVFCIGALKATLTVNIAMHALEDNAVQEIAINTSPIPLYNPAQKFITPMKISLIEGEDLSSGGFLHMDQGTSPIAVSPMVMRSCNYLTPQRCEYAVSPMTRKSDKTKSGLQCSDQATSPAFQTPSKEVAASPLAMQIMTPVGKSQLHRDNLLRKHDRTCSPIQLSTPLSSIQIHSEEIAREKDQTLQAIQLQLELMQIDLDKSKESEQMYKRQLQEAKEENGVLHANLHTAKQQLRAKEKAEEEFQDQLRRKAVEIAQLEELLQSTQSDLQSRNESAGADADEKATLKQRCIVLENEVQHQEQLCILLTQEKASQKKALEKAQHETDQIEAQLAHANAQASEYLKHGTALQQDRDELQRQYNQLKKSMEKDTGIMDSVTSATLTELRRKCLLAIEKQQAHISVLQKEVEVRDAEVDVNAILAMKRGGNATKSVDFQLQAAASKLRNLQQQRDVEHQRFTQLHIHVSYHSLLEQTEYLQTELEVYQQRNLLLEDELCDKVRQIQLLKAKANAKNMGGNSANSNGEPADGDSEMNEMNEIHRNMQADDSLDGTRNLLSEPLESFFDFASGVTGKGYKEQKRKDPAMTIGFLPIAQHIPVDSPSSSITRSVVSATPSIPASNVVSTPGPPASTYGMECNLSDVSSYDSSHDEDMNHPSAWIQKDSMFHVDATPLQIDQPCPLRVTTFPPMGEKGKHAEASDVEEVHEVTMLDSTVGELSHIGEMSAAGEMPQDSVTDIGLSAIRSNEFAPNISANLFRSPSCVTDSSPSSTSVCSPRHQPYLNGEGAHESWASPYPSGLVSQLELSQESLDVHLKLDHCLGGQSLEASACQEKIPRQSATSTSAFESNCAQEETMEITSPARAPRAYQPKVISPSVGTPRRPTDGVGT